MRVSDLQVLRAYQQQGPGFADQKLMIATGECEKVCFRAMERVERKGFIDSGVTLRSGWLTPAGLTRLSELEAAASAS